MKRTVQLVVGFAFVLAGCDSNAPLQTESHSMHPGGLMLADLEKSGVKGQTLDDLRQLTAPLHNLDAALQQGYALLKAPPATAADGCISSKTEGGMGYHYTRGNNLADDAATLLDPEFIVYAPKQGPLKEGETRRQLAALEYFLPFSAKWPAPTDPTFQRAPSLHDFSTFANFPDLSFAPTTRFGGWMFHIWLWENNPDGLFTNFNTSVPLCEGSTF